MAARKSCTHLTWSEAKAKSGSTGSNSGGFKKNKEVLRKTDHGKILAQKVIAGAMAAAAAATAGGPTAALVDDKKLKRAHRRQEEKAEAVSARRREEKERLRVEAAREVRPYDRAKERAAQMMEERRSRRDTFPSTERDDDGKDHVAVGETLQRVAECRRLQMDELLALGAMFPPDSDDFVPSKASRLDELERLLEALDDAGGGSISDGGDETTLAAIARHPPPTFWIKLEVDDPRSCGGGTAATDDDDNDDGGGGGSGDDDNDDDGAMDLNAVLVFRVTLPPLYLDGTGEGPQPPQMPTWTFEYVMVTDRRQFCSADRALESLAWLDEGKLKVAMAREAEEVLLPYPCVYELSVPWLKEHVFEYLHMQPHLSLPVRA